MFLIAYLKAAADLAHIRQIAGIACQLVDPPFVMGWDLVAIRWFCELCCGVVGSEGYSNVSVLKQVGDSAYVWGGKAEGCPLWSVFISCGGVWRALFCVVFSVLIC